MKKILFTITSVAAIANSSAAIILSVDDSRVVSDLTTSGTLSTVDGTSASYSARSRASTSENSQQVVTFLKFDVTTLTPADVNAVGFTATFRINFTAKLNTTNALAVLVGRNTGGNWDSSGSNNPLHDWAFNDESNTPTILDGQTLISNVATETITDNLSVDITSIVQEWVNGVNPNHGLAIYYNSNAFQGAGFESPEIVVVPEPSSILFTALGLASLILRRRRLSY